LASDGATNQSAALNATTMSAVCAEKSGNESIFGDKTDIVFDSDPKNRENRETARKEDNNS
jgi:hypothetical protein